MSFPKFKESLKPQIDSKSEVTPDTDLLLIQVAHQKDEENNRHKIKIYALRLFAGLGGCTSTICSCLLGLDGFRLPRWLQSKISRFRS